MVSEECIDFGVHPRGEGLFEVGERLTKLVRHRFELYADIVCAERGSLQSDSAESEVVPGMGYEHSKVRRILEEAVHSERCILSAFFQLVNGWIRRLRYLDRFHVVKRLRNLAARDVVRQVTGSPVCDCHVLHHICLSRVWGSLL